MDQGIKTFHYIHRCRYQHIRRCPRLQIRNRHQTKNRSRRMGGKSPKRQSQTHQVQKDRDAQSHPNPNPHGHCRALQKRLLQVRHQSKRRRPPQTIRNPTPSTCGASRKHKSRTVQELRERLPARSQG